MTHRLPRAPLALALFAAFTLFVLYAFGRIVGGDYPGVPEAPKVVDGPAEPGCCRDRGK